MGRYTLTRMGFVNLNPFLEVLLMYKLKLFLLPVALLLGFMAFACTPPDDDAPSSGPSKSPKEVLETEQVEDKQSEVSDDNKPSKQPKDKQVEDESRKLPKASITSATYDVGTALLTVQGTHLGSAQQAQIQTIKVYDLVLSSYTADEDATGADSRSLAKGKYRIKRDGTAIWLKLTDRHKATLNGKTGMDSNGRKDAKLSVASGTGTWAGLDTAKDLAVSGNPPAITRATYNAITGVLLITGTNLPKVVDSWDFSKLKFVAGNGDKSPALKAHENAGENTATGSAASATSLTITLTGTEQLKAYNILVVNGRSDDDGAYNLEATAGFAGGRAADTSNNPINVSGYDVNRLSYAKYYSNSSLLIINGSGLPTTVADWDFSKLTLVSGDGSKKFKLPKHSTSGEDTATANLFFSNAIYIRLSGSVKAKANAILVQNGVSDDGGAYNLEAAAGFVTGSAADRTTSIKVSGW